VGVPLLTSLEPRAPPRALCVWAVLTCVAPLCVRVCFCVCVYVCRPTSCLSLSPQHPQRWDSSGLHRWVCAFPDQCCVELFSVPAPQLFSRTLHPPAPSSSSSFSPPGIIMHTAHSTSVCPGRVHRYLPCSGIPVHCSPQREPRARGGAGPSRVRQDRRVYRPGPASVPTSGACGGRSEPSSGPGCTGCGGQHWPCAVAGGAPGASGGDNGGSHLPTAHQAVGTCGAHGVDHAQAQESRVGARGPLGGGAGGGGGRAPSCRVTPGGYVLLLPPIGLRRGCST
jgi:hypothetical protein